MDAAAAKVFREQLVTRELYTEVVERMMYSLLDRQTPAVRAQFRMPAEFADLVKSFPTISSI